MKEYTIRDIEALTEAQAAAKAIEVTEIKGHQIYFVDFGGYFGYSVLVFADGHHIKYANCGYFTLTASAENYLPPTRWKQ
mgnify:CR=1 FL=1